MAFPERNSFPMVRSSPPLARLRPRSQTLYVSCGRTVMAGDPNGWLNGDRDHGLFVHETRVLSHYYATIDRLRPLPVACSNLDQRSSIGYFILTPPGFPDQESDSGSGLLETATQQTLELR